MITLTKNGNAIVFTFSDNAHYLFDGTIEVPVNSLTLITDNSQMATFKKSASNDVFISATYAELGMSKSELESWFKENACGSTGGGGVTSGEVETMIDQAISGKQDTLIAGSGITISGNVISSEGGNKVVELTQAQYDALVDKDPDTFYIITDAEAIDINNYYTKTEVNTALAAKANTATTYNKTEVDTALANKADISAVTESISSAVSGKANTSAVTAVDDALTAHTADTTVHVTSAQTASWDAKSDFSGSYNDLTDKPTIPTVPTSNTAFTNDAGYITSGEAATQIEAATSGKADTSAVTEAISSAVSGKVNTSAYNAYTAVTDSRLAEDEEVTAAGLNALNDALGDKADTSAVTASIAAAVSGKQDTLIAGSGITISGNVISSEGGGGKAIVAGRGIEVTTGATADTVSFSLPISAGTGENSIVGLDSNTVNAKSSFAFGSGNILNASNTGYSNNFAIGKGNSADGGGNLLFGSENSLALANGSSVLIGRKNRVLSSSNSDNFLIGENNYINQTPCKYNTVLGHNNAISTSNVQYASILGYYLSPKNMYEIALGKYNSSNTGSTDADKTLLSVGNGTSTSERHNAFEIRQNGDIYCSNGTSDVKLQDYLQVKVVKISQSDYDALVSGGTVDNNTLYIIQQTS